MQLNMLLDKILTTPVHTDTSNTAVWSKETTGVVFQYKWNCTENTYLSSKALWSLGIRVCLWLFYSLHEVSR